MYDLLSSFTKRPAPFSRYTTKELWTRPHLAKQMLQYHLNQDTDLASRRFELIDAVVEWIDHTIGLPGIKVCDLGCGPGLYTQRFASKGAMVTGVDFSATSLNYARNQNGDAIRYIQADYLDDDLPWGFDLITLIYTDLCVLSPVQRKTLLSRMHNMLNPGGKIILDVANTSAFDHRQEETVLEENLMGGFWAPGDYIGIKKTILYPESNLVLDRYLVVEPDESWEILNWFQHFSPAEIKSELQSNGFEVLEMTGDLTGEKLTPESNFIGIVAKAV